mmetsp:Transcript_20623/g.22908  ORF Transcript_20623/g.22908 Transcript_20623/m.22908 type:complete len:171 (+) Transcript_20623:25-537(+)
MASSLLGIPTELHYIITSIDNSVFVVWPLLCKQTATTSRFSYDLVKNGVFKKWAFQQLVEVQSFTMGVRDGLCTQWYKNGTKKSELGFKNGQRSGVSRKWYQNGQLYEVCCYNNNVLEGDCTKWYASGKVYMKKTYKEGKEIGKSEYWNEDGTIEKAYIIDKNRKRTWLH